MNCIQYKHHELYVTGEKCDLRLYYSSQCSEKIQDEKNDGIQAFTSQMIVKLVVVARKQLLESGWKQSVSEST